MSRTARLVRFGASIASSPIRMDVRTALIQNVTYRSIHTVRPAATLPITNNMTWMIQTTPIRLFSDDNKSVVEEHHEEKKEPEIHEDPEAMAKTEDPRVSKLQTEVTELKDHMLRALADAENARKIAKRDVENAHHFAITKFAKSLLDVADNLQLAISSIPEEDVEKDEQLKALMDGVKMTESALMKAFHSHDLHKFGEKGDKFDPNMHDALYQLNDPSLEPGTLAQVLKCGYRLHERVIRPAQVGTNAKR